MKHIKYILLSAILIGFTSCNDDDSNDMAEQPLPELTAGSADFSNYVAVGSSFTAGYTDGALFKAAQENSFPNILSQQFVKIGGGNFKQPLTNDNYGGLASGGTRLLGFDPRLVFGGAGPVALESVIGPVTVTTDITLNKPTGPFNNLGVPGAKSFHLLSNAYGNPAGLQSQPATANPYFVRIASSPTATVLGDAVAQNPTFFTLSEIGGNDVLGFATSGGDGTSTITPPAEFNGALTAIMDGLTANGAKGVITTLPNIADLPHFTTVPFAPLSPANPSFGPLIPTLNTVFGALNPIFQAIDPSRIIVFSETAASPVVIKDESLPNISVQISGALSASPSFPVFLSQFGLDGSNPIIVQTVAGLFGNLYGQARQATKNDLLVLPSKNVIGTINTDFAAQLMMFGVSQAVAGQFAVEGVTLPLEDKWVLIPSEQTEIKVATDAYNVTISSMASTKGLALVDLNMLLTKAATTGLAFDEYTMNTSLVFGGLISLDGIHLTARGYALMANKFLEAIDAKFGSNFIASGNVAKAGDYPTTYSPTLQ